jgi:hypothetical protein
MATYKVDIAPGEASVEVEADRIEVEPEGVYLMQDGDTKAFFPHPRSVVRVGTQRDDNP